MSTRLGRYAVTVLLLATGLALALSQAQPPILQSVNAPRTTEPREKQTHTSTTELGSTTPTAISTTTGVTTTTTTQSLTIYVTQLQTVLSTTTQAAELNKPMRTLETANTEIWPNFSEEEALLIGVAVAGFIAGVVVTGLIHEYSHGGSEPHTDSEYEELGNMSPREKKKPP